MEILTSLAGLNFRPASAKEAVDAIAVGDELTLERDPTNEYDSNAVRVIDPASGEFIGFIPKVDNTEIAQALDDGLEVTCKVVSFLATRKPGFKVTFEAASDDEDESEA